MPSPWIEYWPAVAIVVGLILALLLSFRRLGQTAPPYERRPALLTEGELVFFHALREAVGGDFLPCAMVRLADLIQVRPQTPDHLSWRNRILCKHIDFVLCHHESMEVQLAIELDDRTHQRADRRERDAFVDGALRAAGIPLLRVQAASSYDPEHLREAIQDRLDTPVAGRG